MRDEENRLLRPMRISVLAGLLCVFLLLTPATSAGPVAVNLSGDAQADYLAVSGTGNARAAGAECSGGTCKSGVAISGTGTAWGGAAAVSGTNNSSSGFYCPPIPIFCTGGTAVSGTGNASGTNAAVSGTGDAKGGLAISALGTCHEWWSQARPTCILATGTANATAWWVAVAPLGNASAHWLAVAGDSSRDAFYNVAVMGDAGHASSRNEFNATFGAVSVFGDAHACGDDPSCTAISVFGEAEGANAIAVCEIISACPASPAHGGAPLLP